jgi:hypothetical protein
MRKPHKCKLFNVRFTLFCHLRLKFRSLREFAVGLSSHPTIVKILLANGIEHRAELRYTRVSNRVNGKRTNTVPSQYGSTEVTCVIYSFDVSMSS